MFSEGKEKLVPGGRSSEGGLRSHGGRIALSFRDSFNTQLFEDVPLVEFIVFTRMPHGVTVGD